MGGDTVTQLRLQDLGIKAKFVSDAVVAHYVPKKRCIPEWVLRRLYKIGVTDRFWGREQVRKQEKGSIQKRDLAWFKEELVLKIAKGNWYAIFGLLGRILDLLGYLQGKARTIMHVMSPARDN